MPNMSHCRFSNTLSVLRDCAYAMEGADGLSAVEAKARERLIELCVEIALDWGEYVGRPVEAAIEGETP